MLGSGIIDVAIGLAFTFGVTAALSSVFTELISRFLGLRGAFLLSGLRELLDGTGGQTALEDAIKNYETMKGLVQPPARAAAGRAKPAATPAAAKRAAAPAATPAAAPAAAPPPGGGPPPRHAGCGPCGRTAGCGHSHGGSSRRCGPGRTGHEVRDRRAAGQPDPAEPGDDRRDHQPEADLAARQAGPPA